MAIKSISSSLLTRVLSVYFLLTLIVTAIQIGAEYFDTKRVLIAELQNQQSTFNGSLTRSLWEFNSNQIDTIADGLISIPAIAGVLIRDDAGNILVQLGETTTMSDLPDDNSEGALLPERNGIFGYYDSLIFEFSGHSTKVGDVSLFSTRDIAIDRIKVSLGFIIGNAIIKSIFLIVLFTIAFNRMLNRPLSDLTQQIKGFRLDNLERSRIRLDDQHNNELVLVEQAYNQLLDNIEEYQSDLDRTQKKLKAANRQLDEQNAILEQEVARKTSSLSQVMLDLEQRKNELEMRQEKLEREVGQRRAIENTLRQSNQRLESSLNNLRETQQQLIESEKMASLGGLVAGITHDVNTPIGISVTASSYLREKLDTLDQSLLNKELTQTQLKKFIEEGRESLNLLDSNLHRASDLISSFKQVAVDQASDAIRDINLKSYIEDLVQSLQPHLKKTNHQVRLECADDIFIRCPAGALSQIFTNLILNSLRHAFDGISEGLMIISIRLDGETLQVHYSDNGNGLSEAQLKRLFDPFFTTKRDQGGSGLGTHIVRNLVTQTLSGEISAESEPGKGLSYFFSFSVQVLN
ncbi:sensor histidine kinase [Idiomarina loihiensis]|jgi:signal transduction histidine kinase|uniref:sensor histidine kinase n=1 Tax=Idiomarina TaxID=135575 RepID=UPI000C0E67F6|nr:MULTISPECIES: ATP-binding protein [Idiomarina]MRJ44888.1 sensor histidine kinase [Idiomarina loihiensis]PHQ90486.1 MAG: ATP-binding protein [Idiomarina sp.]TDO51951.1 signal transduction histidine kinase [Idiomarina sp. 017G]UTW33158.1 sensor histidine kinase [Idiomarina loihiensis]